jgi:hypothetical protein
MSHSKDIRNEAIRLRTDEYLGLGDISTLLKISKSTASLWLKDYPLSEGDLLEKRKFKVIQSSIPSKKCSTSMLGMAAEYIFIARLLLLGLECYTPVSGSSKVDVIVGNNLRRCQVKTIRISNNMKFLPLTKVNSHLSKVNTHRYSDLDIDVMVGVDIDTFDVYIAPIALLDTYKTTVSLSTLEKLGCKNTFSVFSG